MAVFTAIGGAIATALGGGAIATFIGSLAAGALSTAAGIGLSLIGRSLAGQENQQSRPFSILTNVQAGDAVSQTVPFGYGITAGSMAYYNSWGSANSFFTQVIAVGNVPIRDYGRVMIDGSYITLDASPHASRGYPALQYRKGGVDHLWVKFYLGDQVTADTFLTGTVASADRPYTSARVGYGIPYIIVTSRAPERTDGEDQPLFSGFPKVRIEFDIGKAMLDPSDVGQDPDDDSTWGGVGDLNPAVQLFNVLRGIRYEGEWIIGLQGTTAAMVPANLWAGYVTKAQTAIAKPSGGTEPTYRAGGEIRVNNQNKTIVEGLLTAMQGRLINVGGIYKLSLGTPDAPVYAFTDDDILSSDEQSFSPHLSLADTINGISITFPSPGSGWRDKVKTMLRTDLEDKVGGRRLMASVSLDMVPYAAQAQRLMTSALLEAQRERRLTVVLGPEAWVLEPGDYVEWTSERNGFTDKLFRVDGVIDRANGDIVLDLTEVDPTDYDWDVGDFDPVIDGPIGLLTPPSVPVSGWQVFPDIIYDNASNARRPTIRVEYSGGVSGVRGLRVIVRLDAVAHDGDIVFDSDSIPYGTPYAVKLNGTFTPDTDYEVQGVFLMDSPGVTADWSSPLDVTTPDVRFSGLDIAEHAIDITQLVEDFERDVSVTLGYDGVGIHARVQELRDQIEQLALDVTTLGGVAQAWNFRVEARFNGNEATFAQQVLTFVTSEQALAQQITTLDVSFATQLSLANAAIITEQTTRASGDAALAVVDTSLLASYNDVSAGGMSRFEVTATAGGATASYQLAIRAVVAGVTYSGGLRLDLVGTAIRLFINADQFIVGNGAYAGSAPFSVSGGATYISNAYIVNLTAGNVTAGTVTADLLVVGGKVITAHMTNNAITNSSSTFNTGVVTGIAGSETSVLGPTNFTPDDGNLEVIASADVGNSAGSGQFAIRLYRAGVQVAASSLLLPANVTGRTALYYLDTSPGTSAVSWELKAIRISGASNMQCGDRLMQWTNLKK